ncbi:MAG: glutamate synthase-related protein [Synechococcaceae cyanobacterium]|nr:glutamate synthase-related protein [Synechococcaceae cyanobacterium]
MGQPVVAATTPITVTLEAGREYLYCSCGRSADQPFCDGSHRGTGFTPLPFRVEKDRRAALCRCKRTADAPYCDGSHADLAGDRPEGSQPAEGREEPYLDLVRELAENGLEGVGPHGPVVAMGVPRRRLPDWDDIQILTAQLARLPLPEKAEVGTDLVIGPQAERPLRLAIPLLVSDMSFGALSEEAKVALARGAERAGTGICSGEGGMLPEEVAANHRYLYELAPAKFGYREEVLERVQAFHFKLGQAAKTGVGGSLPAGKVTERIAAVRGVAPGQPARSPSRFPDLKGVEDFRAFAARVRERSGGIPVGVKMSAQHLERDLDAALEVGVDYIVLDGRGGGTGGSPSLLRDHTAVPTMAALARARRHLDRRGVSARVTLIITGGLRTPSDLVKALALGADGIALATAALQAIGCVASRICHTNRCPAGVATQDPALRRRLDIDNGARRLATFLGASVALMQVMARACGHDHLHRFSPADLCSWKRDVADLAGISWSGPRGED